MVKCKFLFNDVLDAAYLSKVIKWAVFFLNAFGVLSFFFTNSSYVDFCMAWFFNLYN